MRKEILFKDLGLYPQESHQELPSVFILYTYGSKLVKEKGKFNHFK